jgi:hypothetical protein
MGKGNLENCRNQKFVRDGMTFRCLLMHYITRRKVAGFIPEICIGHFNSCHLSRRTMGLELIQHLKDMSNKCAGKDRPAGRKAISLPFVSAFSTKYGSLHVLKSYGPPSTAIIAAFFLASL